VSSKNEIFVAIIESCSSIAQSVERRTVNP
jgi:hypothetical protein